MKPLSLKALERRLLRFHRSKAERVLAKFSPIAGPQFPRQFNVAGFYPAVLALAERPGSFWGIDRCLRIDETVDAWHSRLFHMGVFARSLDLKSSFANAAADARFHHFQREILCQFFDALDALAIPRARLEASYFDGATLGGHPDGRDARLKKTQKLAADCASRDCLTELGVKSVGVPSIASVFIQPREGSLVGPRVEIFFDGIEVATIMFLCFRVRRGELRPINYIGVYGMGLERLVAMLDGGDFLRSIPRYAAAREMIAAKNPAARSRMLEREIVHVLFGLEALAALPDRLTRTQARRVLRLKAELKWFILNLGLEYRDVRALYDFFRRSA